MIIYSILSVVKYAGPQHIMIHQPDVISDLEGAATKSKSTMDMLFWMPGINMNQPTIFDAK